MGPPVLESWDSWALGSRRSSCTGLEKPSATSLGGHVNLLRCRVASLRRPCGAVAAGAQPCPPAPLVSLLQWESVVFAHQLAAAPRDIPGWCLANCLESRTLPGGSRISSHPGETGQHGEHVGGWNLGPFQPLQVPWL